MDPEKRIANLQWLLSLEIHRRTMALELLTNIACGTAMAIGMGYDVI